MKTAKKTRAIVATLAFGLVLPLLACEDEGPAERAGRQIDEAAEETAGAFEELGREVGEAADESKEAAEEIREAAEE